MRLDELWNSLEADIATGTSGKAGWLMRLARPNADCLLFVAIEIASHRRAILLQLPSDSVPSRRLWPRSKGLEPLAVAIDGDSHFGVALKESRFADVFTALAEDLCRRVIEADGPDVQARAFLGQLARWQKFLSVSLDGLSEEAQRGLWGELRFLREHLFPLIGSAAISGWKGGERAHQDFHFQTTAIEVKTTLAKKPQIVRITSERQLDSTAWSSLFLCVTTLDVLESGGETLPTIVASIRAKISADVAAQEQFEDELLSAGYLDVHATQYAGRGYNVRSSSVFRVTGKFPRIVEADLMTGVGDTNYGLSISACESFRVSADEISSAVASPAHSKPKRRLRG